MSKKFNSIVIEKISGKRFARESFIWAQVIGKVIAASNYKGTCNTQVFNQWIEDILIPELKPDQIVIMGNLAFINLKRLEN